ncbi:hypothetical protein V2I01_15565 [Micromonospora sp. BRA006-A]|nr:hypothetical protein [Micromonospora sp. BRA006-A]
MSTLTGTRHLVRLILRRDRLLLPLWVLVLAVLPITYAASFFELFPTAAERAAYLEGTARNPSIVALLGPAYGDSVGALTAQRSGFLLLIVALASLLTVIRHTRTEEEAGRRELLGGSVLGRHAGLTAALLVTYGADLVLGLLTAAGLVSTGLPVGGSVAYGLVTVLTGAVFATLGGLAAQLTETAGGARGVGLAGLGAAFGLRLAGDTAGNDWPSWLSPLGWAARVRPYEGSGGGCCFCRWPRRCCSPRSRTRSRSAAIWARACCRPARPGRRGRRVVRSVRAGVAAAPGQILWWSVGFGLLGLILGGAAEAAGRSVEGARGWRRSWPGSAGRPGWRTRTWGHAEPGRARRRRVRHPGRAADARRGGRRARRAGARHRYPALYLAAVARGVRAARPGGGARRDRSGHRPDVRAEHRRRPASWAGCSPRAWPRCRRRGCWPGSPCCSTACCPGSRPPPGWRWRSACSRAARRRAGAGPVAAGRVPVHALPRCCAPRGPHPALRADGVGGDPGHSRPAHVPPPRHPRRLKPLILHLWPRRRCESPSRRAASARSREGAGGAGVASLRIIRRCGGR